jgi:hypothetical protein
VFISYTHDDAAIARTLYKENSSIDHVRFDVFLDFEKIEPGGDWKTEISTHVEKADVFIAIFTGDQKHVFDYCGYEVGLFSASRAKGTRRPMFCIYDTKEPPAILSDLQGIPIAYDGDSDKLLERLDGWQADTYAPRMKALFQLLLKLYRTRFGKSLDDVSELKSRAIIQAFLANKGDEVIDERPLCERLIVSLPSVSDWDSVSSIPPAAKVIAVISTFNVLGLPAALPQPNREDGTYSMEWGELVDSLKKQAKNVVPWIDYVEASILAQLKAGNSEPPQLSFQSADGKTYRPIIGRFKLYRNGARRYYVQLIPTLPRGFPGLEETSFPLIGLIFGARFWFKFSEDEDSFLRLFGNDRSDADFDLEVRSLDSYLQRMIAEASEFGLSNKESMKRLMRPQDAPIVDHFFNVWEKSYGALAALLKAWLERKCKKEHVLAGIRTFISDVRPLNRRFMEMMFCELSRRLFGISLDDRFGAGAIGQKGHDIETEKV